MRAFAHGLDALALLPDLLSRMRWNNASMRAAIEPAMYATDAAIEQATRGVPFREAYRRAADIDTASMQQRTPEASLAARISPGAAADPRLDLLRARLASMRIADAEQPVRNG